MIAPRSPDLEGGGGFGLNVVQALSERWGLERIAAGGTRVWAQLARHRCARRHPPRRPAWGRRAIAPQRQAKQRASGAKAAAAPGRNTMTELHVVGDARSTWRVYETDAVEALSEHTSATDAELDARARAEDRAVERVVVHDRHHRTHDTAPSPAGVSAREQAAGARQLALVRDRARRLARARPRWPISLGRRAGRGCS
jgi:hypothetical protein